MRPSWVSMTLAAVGILITIAVGAWYSRSARFVRTPNASAITVVPNPYSATATHPALLPQSPNPPSPQALRSSEQAAQSAAAAAAALAKQQ